MISVNTAWALMMKTIRPLEAERVPLEHSAGRILRESLKADRDYPPFDRVAMDGYALAFAKWESGGLRFAVQDMQTAGQSPKTLTGESTCIEIMTGAKLPEGCDLVIRYEDTERDGDTVVIQPGLVLNPYSNIHRQGVDCLSGLVFHDGIMKAPVAALAASFGYPEVLVTRRARISIIGTGDELVAINASPKDYQIRASNIHAVRMALDAAGHDVISCETLADQRAHILNEVRSALERSDIVLLSGGVSAGKTDFIPSVLADCGVLKVFHKIAQKPGKPLWFGQTEAGKTVFGLPGNPVSTLICFYRYVLPYLEAMSGAPKRERGRVELLARTASSPKLTHFIPVQLSWGSDAKMRAEAPLHNGSGDFSSLTGTHGFIEVPGENEPDFNPSQTLFTYYSW